MEKSKTVYIETSVVSYLTARPSRDVSAAGRQFDTHEWWDTQRHHYELYTSEMTIEEAEKGHPDAARRRLEALDGIITLVVSQEALDLADTLISRRGLPPNAENDAIHIAVAAVNDIDYLLTWNYHHIANATTMPLIREICRRQDYRSLEIVTPNQLIGGFDIG